MCRLAPGSTSKGTHAGWIKEHQDHRHRATVCDLNARLIFQWHASNIEKCFREVGFFIAGVVVSAGSREVDSAASYDVDLSPRDVPFTVALSHFLNCLLEQFECGDARCVRERLVFAEWSEIKFLAAFHSPELEEGRSGRINTVLSIPTKDSLDGFLESRILCVGFAVGCEGRLQFSLPSSSEAIMNIKNDVHGILHGDGAIRIE